MYNTKEHQIAQQSKKSAMTNALFPSFKCNAHELQILKAMITGYSNTEPALDIMCDFESVPWLYTMKIDKADAIVEEDPLWIGTSTTISCGDIVGQDDWESLQDDERVAVGQCLLEMIAWNLIKPSFAVSKSGKASSTVGSKKAVRKK